MSPQAHAYVPSGVPGWHRCKACGAGGTARIHRLDAGPELPREIDNAVFIAAAGRFIRAAGRRVASGDVESLRGLVELQSVLDQAERSAAAALLADGFSTADLARVLGCSRQYAWKRYGTKEVTA